MPPVIQPGPIAPATPTILPMRLPRATLDPTRTAEGPPGIGPPIRPPESLSPPPPSLSGSTSPPAGGSLQTGALSAPLLLVLLVLSSVPPFPFVPFVVLSPAVVVLESSVGSFGAG